MPIKARLSRLPQLPPPVLTAYIDVNPGNPRNQGAPRGYVTWVRSAGQALSEDLSPSARKTFRTQLRRIEEFLEFEQPQCRSVVVFAGPHVWDVVPLQVDVTEELHWGKPSLQQMTWMLDEHRPRGAVLIDGSGASFYRFWLGQVTEDKTAVFSVDLSSWRRPHLVGPATSAVTKQFGTHRDRVENRLEEQRNRFMSGLAERIVRWSREEGFDQIVLVGAPADLDATLDALPARFRKQTMLVPRNLSNIPESDVKDRLRPVLAKWEREYEEALVDRLISDQYSRKSVTGLDRTLTALQRGRVRELVVMRRIAGSVNECLNCGWIDRSADPVCPKCGSERRPRTLRTLIPELAGAQDIVIEVVAGKAAQKLRQVEGIGAWLGVPGRS